MHLVAAVSPSLIRAERIRCRQIPKLIHTAMAGFLKRGQSQIAEKVDDPRYQDARRLRWPRGGADLARQLHNFNGNKLSTQSIED